MSAKRGSFEEVSAFVKTRLDEPFDALPMLRGNQRAKVGGRIERVTDLEVRHCRKKAIHAPRPAPSAPR